MGKEVKKQKKGGIKKKKLDHNKIISGTFIHKRLESNLKKQSESSSLESFTRFFFLQVYTSRYL